MPELNKPEYSHLLSPAIFNVSLKNIKVTIDLLEEYGIGKYITNRCLRRNVIQLRSLIEYLIENNIDLIIDKPSGGYVLNPILNASTKKLKETYLIDIKNLSSKGELKYA